jgi:hypothetical protein
MYALTVLPVLSLTRASFRLAEFGFLGGEMMSWEMTPFLCGAPFKSGALDMLTFRGFLRRMDWLRVIADAGDEWKQRA